MKKFINNVDDFLKESLNGFGKAHSDIIRVNFEPNFISRKTKTKEGKVSLSYRFYWHNVRKCQSKYLYFMPIQ